MCRAAAELDAWHLTPNALMFKASVLNDTERHRDKRRRIDLADVILHAHSAKMPPERVESWFKKLGD